MPDPIDEIRATLEAARTKTRRDRWHRYEVQVGRTWKRMPGVTSVIGILDKPALLPWAARIQQEADIEVAWHILRESQGSDSPWLTDDRLLFEERFRELAGAKKEHQKHLKEASELGGDLHKLIETWCLQRMGVPRPEPVINNEQAYYVYAGFEQWAKSVDLYPLAIEAPVYSLKHCYAGTLDCLALVNGDLTLIDWKTSPRIYPEMRLQNVAYRQALAEMTGQEAAGLLVRLPKTGEDEALEVEPVPITDDVEAFFQVFVSLLPAFAWVKAQARR